MTPEFLQQLRTLSVRRTEEAFNVPHLGGREALNQKVREEIADVVIYLDLLAARCDRELRPDLGTTPRTGEISIPRRIVLLVDMFARARIQTAFSMLCSLASALDIDLEAAVREKFNTVSDRVGWKGPRL